MLTAEKVREIWRYEPGTGRFYWCIAPRYDVNAGDRAGSFDGKYWRLQYKGKIYKASRVAWLIATGEWPLMQIDHVNGDKLDDRLENLRLATNAENARNRGFRRGNVMKGVHADGGRGFVASIMKDGKKIYLGCFSCAEYAAAAYRVAAPAIHGEFTRSGRYAPVF